MRNPRFLIVLLTLLTASTFRTLLHAQQAAQPTGQVSAPRVPQDQDQALLEGVVTDEQGTPLPGANLLLLPEPLAGEDSNAAELDLGTSSDGEGRYRIRFAPGSYRVEIRFVGYETQRFELQAQAGQRIERNITLRESARALGTFVVSGSLYEKALQEEVVSVDVLDASLMERTNTRTLDDAVEKLPGVYFADGQANMRGGTGYSFGVGSRVMMVVDGQPLLSADRGDVKWTMMPVEITDQVEIIKGASSVLYGSGALNGVVHVRTLWPTAEPQTELVVYQGYYGNPRRDTMRWWEENPVFLGGRFHHARKMGRFDLVVGGSLGSDQSYLREEFQEHARFSLKTRYRPKRLDGRLSMGINANTTYYNEGLYLLWADADEGAFQALPNSTDVNSYLWNYFDPWITFFDKAGNQHSGKFRYNYNGNFYSANNRAHIHMLSAEYQFQRRFRSGYGLTAGISNLHGLIRDNDVGRHDANLLALYAQTDKRWNRLEAQLGVRWETFKLDDSSASALPVIKAGVNYKAGRNNWLRASFGQGYRFPSVAERFVDTDVGDLIYIFPNPDLRPEVGWNAEIGTKQVIHIGNWQGYLDLAGFWTEYSDMTEFTFGIYQEGLGFKNKNIGQARIAGLEFTASGQGNIGKVPLQILAGYTYVYPANLSADTTLANPGKFLEFFWKNFDSEDEDVLQTLLAYRFRHVAKMDVQAGYGRFSLGVDVRYFSFMDKIDQVFATFIPGVSDFRERHNGGDFILGLRASADVGAYGNLTVLVNNALNREYSLRPARMDAPRNVSVQYRIRF